MAEEMRWRESFKHGQDEGGARAEELGDWPWAESARDVGAIYSKIVGQEADFGRKFMNLFILTYSA